LSINTLYAILVNVGIILVVSWVFGLYFIFQLANKKNELAEQLKELRKKNPQGIATKESFVSKSHDQDTPDYSELLAQMALDIKEKEDRISVLMAIKDNQQEAKNNLQNTTDDDAISSYLEQLEADFEETERIILSLQEDLENSRLAMKNMETQLANGETRELRNSILEKTERRLKDENKKIRKTGTQLAEKLDTRNKQVNKLKADNKKLQKSIASLSNASKEQLAVIKKLHDQIERAQKLEDYQRKMIDDLEKRLTSEKGDGNDLEKVGEMESELEKLRDTLKRTLIEKEFIEEHMLELDETLEKARETEEALARAHEEIASLEHNFPEYEPPVIEDAPESNGETSSDSSDATNTPAIIERPPFTTEIPELLEVMENNRLFGSLMEFWTTLDLPPLNLVKNDNIPMLSTLDWVYITIGNNDYSVLLTVDEQLAKTLSASIFNSSNNDDSDDTQKDTTGELCNVVAGTIATEMEKGFPVSTPEHIDHETAKQWLTESTLVAETLASAQDKPIYIALMIPQPIT
jgi:CheY-specific phosphatase CheX